MPQNGLKMRNGNLTLVMTRRDRSIRFMSRSEIVFLTYWVAPGMSRSMRILWRHSVTKFLTSRQLSLLTVSIPAGSSSIPQIQLGSGKLDKILNKWRPVDLIPAKLPSHIMSYTKKMDTKDGMFAASIIWSRFEMLCAILVLPEIDHLPFVSILSYFSGLVHKSPAYLFLLISKYGQ